MKTLSGYILNKENGGIVGEIWWVKRQNKKYFLTLLLL